MLQEGGGFTSASGGAGAFYLFCMQALETLSGALWNGPESREHMDLAEWHKD